MFQKCPICNGTGRESQPLSNRTSTICTVCNGAKIINEITGLPPSISNEFEIANEIFKHAEPLGDFKSKVLDETLRRLYNSEPTLPGRK